GHRDLTDPAQAEQHLAPPYFLFLLCTRIGRRRPAEYLHGEPGGRGIFPEVSTAVVEVRSPHGDRPANRGG
ncbi:MAG TPA: hypothetical protein VNV39_15935, partial [Stellaceae bacterium]|nr:hypothetical protein [Stellaceae bacterium]